MTGDPFVGRASELAALRSAIGRAAAGRGGLVVVAGEPGIGKTALVAHALDGTTHAAVWVRHRPVAGTPPMWTWAQAGRAAAARGLPPPPRPALARVPATGSGAERFRRFDRLGTWLTEAATIEPPLVAVLDDVQWADPDSLAFLHFVAPALIDAPLLLLVTARAGEVPDLPRADAHLMLAGLEGADLASLLTELTGTPPEADVVAAAHAATAGSPFAVLEVAREVAAAGRTADPAAWRSSLPAGVRAVLTTRLRALPAGTQDVLTAAAVLGQEVEVALLGRLTELAAGAVADALAPALARGVLRDLRDGRVAFPHALVRDAALEVGGAGVRQRHHRRAAELLQADAGPSPAPAIAAHLFAAGDVATAAAWAAGAGDEAFAEAMYADAAAWYGRAIAAGIRSASLLARQADALARCGRPADAADAYQRAVTAARAEDDGEALARAALGMGSLGGGFEVRLLDDAQLALLDEALARLGPADTPERAMLLARLSVAGTLSRSQDERRRLADDAVAMARRLGHDGALASALGAWCDAHAGPKDQRGRVDAAAQMLAAALRAGDPELELLARRLRIVAAMEEGDRSTAWREIDAVTATAESLRQPAFLWYARLMQGMRALLRGELDEAERYGREAADLGRAARSRNARLLAEGALLPAISRWRDDPTFYERIDAANRQHYEASRDLDVGVLFAARTGAPHDALRAALAQIDPLAMVSEDDAILLQAVALTTDAACVVGDLAIVDRLEPVLAAHPDTMILDGWACVCYGPVSQVLGHVAVARGNLAAARDWFERARDAVARLGAPLLLRNVDADLDTLGATTAPSSVRAIFRREGDVWLVGMGGSSARLRHSKGLSDLAELIDRPGREVHVFDLVAVAEGTTGSPRPAGAGTGPVLDAHARAAYEQRIRDLTDDIEQAEAHHDLERAARLDDERAALLTQLAAALGLGGRPRTAASDVERARKAVAMRLRDAIARIEREVPELGRHLRHAVHTGTSCSYQPEHLPQWERDLASPAPA